MGAQDKPAGTIDVPTDLLTGVPAYPSGPGYSDQDTSKAAAASVKATAPKLAEVLLSVIRMKGPMTADELELATGKRAQSITARLRNLVMAGKLVDTGDRRKTRRGRAAKVYDLAPEGHQPPQAERDLAKEAAGSLYGAFSRVRALDCNVDRIAENEHHAGGYRWTVTLGWVHDRTGQRMATTTTGATMVDALNAACDEVAEGQADA